MGEFDGRIALVTGATGNLGQAVARRLHDGGARVALLVRDRSRAATAFSGLDSERLLLVEADLADAASVRDAVSQVVAQWGAVDLLANLAGGFRMGPAVHETPLEDFGEMMNLNLYAALHTAQAVVPHMQAAGGGRIVNVGARVEPAPARMGAYAASKSALLRITEAMSAELGQQDINVNAILPGVIDTPQNRAAMPDADRTGWVTPEQLADVVAFLFSPAAAAVHGALIPVTGRG